MMDDKRYEDCTYSAVHPGMDSVIFSSLRELAKKNTLMDLTLIMHDGKTLRAHKIILAAISAYFETVLQKIPWQQSEVVCLGKEFDGMENLLKLIYEDEVIFTSKAEQEDFRRLCAYLKIRDCGTILYSRNCMTEPKAYDENVPKRKRGPKRRVPMNENCSVLEQLLLNSSQEYEHQTASINGDRPLNLSFSPPSEHAPRSVNNGTTDDEDEDGKMQPYLKIRSEESLREVEGESSDEGRNNAGTTKEVRKIPKHECDSVAPTVFKQERDEPCQNVTNIGNPDGKDVSGVQQRPEAEGSQHEATARSKETVESELSDSSDSACSSVREITIGAKNANTASAAATVGHSMANPTDSSKTNVKTPNNAKKRGPTNKDSESAANGQARPKSAVKRKQNANWPYSLPPSYSEVYHNLYKNMTTQMKGMQEASGPQSTYASFCPPPVRLPPNALKLMPPFVVPKASQKVPSDTSALRTMCSISKTSNLTNGGPRRNLVWKKSGNQVGSKGPVLNLSQAVASTSGGSVVKKPRTKMDAMRGIPSSYSQAGMNGRAQQFLHTKSNASDSGLSACNVSDVRKSSQVSHDKPFKCYLCPKQFVYHKKYLDHISQHNGGFTCEACQKSFATQNYLERHKEDGKCIAKSNHSNQL